ncbi:uncharacterized protein LOC107745830 [Sinocyclocheilus rhinocerous]|uniref:uncharacterized protein LOC107745830 n=1 Tax=Sinocyclocheilus rhinocerous TaxID=307959 RepID=UPI0007B99A8C|nr:PREDICTED: uncharacterized protein LOC107745830 [Sinocyclocheilus rhinocerous]
MTMYNSCGLLFLSFGFTMLEFITCYGDGFLLESECQGMDIKHGVPAQNGEAPFKIEPEYIEVTDSELGTENNVSVTAYPAEFTGFMLDARKCDKCESAGMFNLTNPANSILICGGHAVAQTNNQRKTIVQVLWTPEETGVFFFRAAFVEEYSKVWLRKAIIFTSTAPPTTEATSHSTQTSPTDMSQTQTAPPTSEATSAQKKPTTSPTIFTTTSNIDSHATVAPALPPQCVQYTVCRLHACCYIRCALALLLFSRLCFLGGSSLLMIIRPVSKMATMIASVFELASKTIAVIFILIKLIKYECVCECDSLQTVFTALTVAAMASSLLHTLTVFLHCGPSHELRKCWLCAIITVGLMNTIITTTAIFFGIWCFQERWLPSLMGAFVIWEFMFYLGSVCFEQMGKYQSRKNQNHVLEKRSHSMFT